MAAADGQGRLNTVSDDLGFWALHICGAILLLPYRRAARQS